MATRKRGNSWWVDFRHSGTRFRKRSPDNSKAGAEAFEASLRSKLARGELLPSAAESEKQEGLNRTFADFARYWLETYAKNNNKASEVLNKHYVIERSLNPFFGLKKVSDISANDIEEFKAKEKNLGLANKTINNHLIVLAKCLKSAQEWYDIPKIPKIQKLKIPPQSFDFLSPSESQRLVDGADGVWKDAILTFLKTGMRLGELIALQWPDVNLDNGTIAIRYSWSNAKKGLETPKSNKVRHIPLTRELVETLSSKRQKHGFVFTIDGQRIGTRRMDKHLKLACKKVGLRQIGCHVLRHTFASHLAMKGAPIKAIQELLGHSNSQITERYAHLMPSSLQSTISLLEPKSLTFADFGHYMVTTEKSLGTKIAQKTLLTAPNSQAM